MAIAVAIGEENILLRRNLKINFIATDVGKKNSKKIADTSLFSEKS